MKSNDAKKSTNLKAEFNKENIRKFYKNSILIVGPNGNLPGDQQDMKNRWMKYFETIMDGMKLEQWNGA